MSRGEPVANILSVRSPFWIPQESPGDHPNWLNWCLERDGRCSHFGTNKPILPQNSVPTLNSEPANHVNARWLAKNLHFPE